MMPVILVPASTTNIVTTLAGDHFEPDLHAYTTLCGYYISDAPFACVRGQDPYTSLMTDTSYDCCVA
ncbi:hypothetical protein HO173_012835 [Letharia columbiana]|uniref:Uncharacterized protein n=1 Tax=Letharia columbiana TaxID=112416 RepID=A0A8H6CLC6_9LECA|nr:uncharacterized protein HO173_012835 [Letharia columbiana]KAF6225311.1 hypothetical protein HO173_012835 [Letharia columbiana]